MGSPADYVTSLGAKKLNTSLERNGTLSIHMITQFFKMNLKTCPLLRRVIFRSPQGDYGGVKHIFPSGSAPLPSIGSGMMNEQNRNSSTSEFQKPFLDRSPGTQQRVQSLLPLFGTEIDSALNNISRLCASRSEFTSDG